MTEAPPMITPEETAELERVLADATPGPLLSRTNLDFDGYVDGYDIFAPAPTTNHPDAYRIIAQDMSEADAKVFVFLRNHADTLLAAARQAEAKDARIAELEAAIGVFVDGMHANEQLYAHFGTDGKMRPGAGDETRLYAPAKAWRDLRRAARLTDPSSNAGGDGA